MLSHTVSAPEGQQACLRYVGPRSRGNPMEHQYEIRRESIVSAEARRKKLEALTAELKRKYLAAPGATEEGFAAALSDLLEVNARAAALRNDLEAVCPV